MRETLIILGVILAIAWLMDRGWSLRGKRPQKTKPAPAIETKREPDPKRKPSQTLHKDWLRLGRRAK